MDRLQSMAVFIKAADTGSFAAAGAALGMSSQMAGKHVGAIEERLGIRLLNRTTRRQSLTEAGRLYYDHCKIALAEFEAAEAVARELTASPRGRLRVSAPVTFGTFSLAPLVAQYLRLYPDVEIDLTVTDRLVDLVDEGYEVAIRLGELSDSSLVARALAPYRLFACAAPSYLAAHGAPETPDDLTRHDCLLFAYSTRPAMTEWTFARDGDVQTVKVSSRFRINDSRALRAAALAGAGILLGAEVMVKDDLASGRLVRVLPDFEAPPRPMHVVFLRERRMTPKVRSFVDLIIAEFG